MSYDERLAERVRIALWERSGVAEIRMFGGLCFTLHAHMCCGVLGELLILRLGENGAAQALAREHTRPMDITGRPSKGIIYVESAGIRTDDALRSWIDEAVAHASTLPEKTAKRARASLTSAARAQPPGTPARARAPSPPTRRTTRNG